MSDAARVLIVEDEKNIRDLLVLHLGLEGYEPVAVADGREALRVFSEQAIDLVVLDWLLPELDGLTVCRAIRRHGSNREVPILMLTARREESDKVLGLESGADDYLVKPFGIRELVARVRALLRRPRAAPRHDSDEVQRETAAAGTRDSVGALPTVRIHGVDIDPARRGVRVDGRAVELTSQEFNLLYVLASHPGIVFTREALLGRVWKGQAYVTVRSVDALVKRLRKKIEIDSASPKRLLTVWGAGYKFADA